METTPRRRAHAWLLTAWALILILLASPVAATPVAQQDQTEEPGVFEEEEALVEFRLPSRAEIAQLEAIGADLAEYVRDNDDGTIMINAFVTPTERAQYEAMGFPAGVTVEDRSTWEAAIAERNATIAAEEQALSAASGEALAAPLLDIPSSLNSTPPLDPGGEVTIMRVDYFTNYAGRFLAVAARTALGTPTGGPTLAMAWRTAGGSYGTASTMSKFNDASQYIYHRLLVRVGAAGSTTPVPATVRVASSTGAVAEGPVNLWVGGGLPPMAEDFQKNFITRYLDATETHQRINALATEFSGLAEIINLPYKSNGYQRKAMAVMDTNTNILAAPGSTARAVYLESKAWGHEGGNSVQAEFLNPGAASQPLTVSVTGSRITVRLGTSATGAINSTAAQVVAALNASPAASALVTAYTYAGSAGGSPVVARSLVTLTDGLSAPASVQRGPFQIQAIRIGKVRDGSKIGVYFYCQQHAREWVTPLVCLETAERLLRNYGTDSLTRELVDNLDIFIVPSFNPDGTHYSMYDFASQRRNMTRYCSVTTTSGMPTNRNAWGVDNNRNNSVGSIFDGYNGASTSCTSDTFAGPSEFSEPENKNDQWLVDTFTNIKFSMNIHTYGGYYMWSPGAYILSGRVPLPPPNIGVEAYFFAGADLVLNRIKEERGTVVLPERTGPIADVLYSAAGNSADDHWYRKDIIAYSFEAGADRFTSTSSGVTQSAVGFQPNFASEGRFEALEFASGNYGLLETALQYARDTTPPQAYIIPNGGASQSPIRATFQYGNEPAVIYYTLDGSTPTTSSPTWEAQGPRRPGQVFLFSHTTTVKWIAKDIKGNVSAVSTARFAVETAPPVTTAALSPAPVNGWYSNPTVTLSADDNEAGGGAGVASSEYRLDGGAWTSYGGPFQVTGDGERLLEFRSTDLAGNQEATRSLSFQNDGTAPTLAPSVAPNPVVLNGGATASPNAADATSGVASASCAAVVTSSVGARTVSCTATDLAGNTATALAAYNVVYTFAGFGPPVDNTPALNSANAGQAIPLKWRLTDAAGAPVTNLASVKVVVNNLACPVGTSADQIEEYAPGSSGLLNLGNGYYQYNWATPKSYARSCKTLKLDLGEGTGMERTALFQFPR
ncbi:MAG TPA: M14 family zinc carboxypeptidase [Chloroflexaceae bacterium]|nr:M14 family zinc carboxypeptidase [Chloroflexaceae bacterium]